MKMPTKMLGLLRDVAFAAFVGGAADVVCQKAEGNLSGNDKDGLTESRPTIVADIFSSNGGFDFRRTCAFAAFTGLYIGGGCTFLYAQVP
jgi:hypothetical protein